MIGYLDTSAFVPLLIDEPGTARCRSVWDNAEIVVSCQLLYVETAAALAQAVRLGRISARHRKAAIALLDDLWDEVTVVAIDDSLVRAAAALAHRHRLRGYDAVHCAAAVRVRDQNLVAATGDRALLAAWSVLGLSTLDTSP